METNVHQKERQGSGQQRDHVEVPVHARRDLIRVDLSLSGGSEEVKYIPELKKPTRDREREGKHNQKKPTIVFKPMPVVGAWQDWF